MQTVRQLFNRYISEKIPKKQTNIFWQMFNGIDVVLNQLEYMLKNYKKERNFLTATSILSLRNLAAQNGFEPKLKIPSKGILSIKVNTKLFNRVGYPLYLTPYSLFKNKTNNLSYYFDSNKTIKIENDVVYVPVVEGELVTLTNVSTGNYLERIYIDSDSIAENSINISVGNNNFVEVKSFFDNENLNENKQFLTKFSNKINIPIIIYVKGTQLNDIINITYRLTSGEYGNINYKAVFETQEIINSMGEQIDISDDEIEIVNISGFNFGSNGTDINSLRASIGFNHGTNLLFDNTSYQEFINKFSNILLQKISISDTEKSINNIYVSKKQYINIEMTNLIKEQYEKIINSKSYLLDKNDVDNLSNLLNENEFCLSSHNLFDSEINKFAIQILFDTQIELEKNSSELQNLIYNNFAIFLYDKNYILNLEVLFNDFLLKNNTIFEYTVFNSNIENNKIKQKQNLLTQYIIKHDNSLPILRGDFNIADNSFNPIKLFFDINIVSKEKIN